MSGEGQSSDDERVQKAPVKRFIAGAVCPKCALMDKLMMYRTEEGEFRECVSCDFSEKLAFKQQPRELETRVNVTEAEKNAQVQVLNFSPSKKPSD